jgi:hypothetical protein
MTKRQRVGGTQEIKPPAPEVARKRTAAEYAADLSAEDAELLRCAARIREQKIERGRDIGRGGMSR